MDSLVYTLSYVKKKSQNILILGNDDQNTLCVFVSKAIQVANLNLNLHEHQVFLTSSKSLFEEELNSREGYF